jgi:hypothetical protein
MAVVPGVGTVLGGVGGGAAGGIAGAAAGLAAANVVEAAVQGTITAVGRIGRAIGSLFNEDHSNVPTAQELIEKTRKGSVNREFPDELRDRTLEEITELAKKGDKRAQSARKLLTDKRFQKP